LEMERDRIIVLQSQLAKQQNQALDVKSAQVINGGAIARFKKIYKRKSDEFDALLNSKVASTLELRVYRGLFENDSGRRGILSPNKRRKFSDYSAASGDTLDSDSSLMSMETDKKSEQSSSSSSFTSGFRDRFSADDDHHALYLSCSDFEGGYAEIRNISDRSIHTSGWVLMSTANQAKFCVPAKFLRPGATFRIVNPTEQVSSSAACDVSGDACVTPQGFWNNVAGDELFLINPLREIVSRVDIVPAVRADRSSDSHHGCSIM